MKNKKVLLVLITSLGLAACGSDGLQDLRQFTKDTYKDSKPRVDPIPEVKVFEKYAYQSFKLPDPFAPDNLSRASASNTPADANDLGPDLTRPKEALEEYPLDAMIMVGTLEKNKERWAIVQVTSAGGEVHRVKVGNHMGRNYGMVTDIAEDRITLVELVRSSLGDWVEREATIQLKE